MLKNPLSLSQKAELLTVMGNEVRLTILMLLLEGEMNVTQLAKSMTISQSALSQHLARLRRGLVVTTRREAQAIYYSSQDEGVRAILTALEPLSAPVKTEVA